jgi:hypothetical protein
MKSLWQIGTLALVGFAAVGCVAEPEGSSDGSGTEPTSVLDESTGDLVATNYEQPEGEPIYVEASDADKNLTEEFQDVWDGSAVTEAAIDMPRDFLMVGVGFRLLNDNVTTLRVHGRRHNADGTLGGIQEFRAGTAPNNDLEVWCAAPVGQVIAGVGTRVYNDNVTTVHIWTRNYNASTRTLGPIEVEPRRCGSVPDYALERRLVTWEHASNADEPRTVWNGIAARVADDNMTSLRGRFRVMQ